VAYSVHDLEDSLVSGTVKLQWLADPLERRQVAETAIKLYRCDAELGELEERFAVLLKQPFWPDTLDFTGSTFAALKNLTSWLIGRFCMAAEEATRAEYGPGRLTRYSADLIVPREVRLECALLKAITAHYVWSSYRTTRAHQREVVLKLAQAIAAGAPDTLDLPFRWAFADAHDDAARLRVVVDQVASLTDTSALIRHSRLVG
jgi:dGTPase